ncbi:nitrate reductase gamma chain [Geobacter sp. OR-1]|uniref:respiratory nitrate reductase subunit gamma n=1 Tax=Geobacter sp. OR-1 TaxID=1266765 RepID=UPI000543B62E|nr:respiratory nitrate reductase subunit gamma [Geobacter sp. OR-1]GAM09939.1 nitrate reductase gamma chain [Geobacter sp. OR-1]
MADMLLYVVFPYVATALAIVGGFYRYFNDRFSLSSLSAQLLEHRLLFWGVVPWHYGIIPILLAHLLAIIFPGWWGFLLGGPDRLTALEVVGMALGMLTLVGIVILILRRLVDTKIRAVTSGMDWLLLALLFLQVALGVHVAMTYRWGSLWYLHTAVPWLRSLAILHPDPSPVVHLPVAVKLHMVNAVIIILLFPFTRLVHIFTFPARYLLRSWQLVWWNKH